MQDIRDMSTSIVTLVSHESWSEARYGLMLMWHLLVTSSQEEVHIQGRIWNKTIESSEGASASNVCPVAIAKKKRSTPFLVNAPQASEPKLKDTFAENRSPGVKPSFQKRHSQKEYMFQTSSMAKLTCRQTRKASACFSTF